MNYQRVGIITGGGDCPGLNPAIKAITKKALENDYEVVGLREGWRSLIDKSLMLIQLSDDVVRDIDRLGGTILGTSRTNPYKVANGPALVMQRVKELKLDALIAIGGEDTLGVASKLYQDFALKVVGIPKTIDADLSETEYCLGFASAVEKIMESIDTLRSTAESHARIFVVEVMGRHAGHLALQGGISAGASIILVPEYPFEIEIVCELLLARKQRAIPYSIVVVAEGAKPKEKELSLLSDEKDAFGHVRLGGIGQFLAEEIEKKCKLECRSVVLSHLQRGGAPVAFDRRMGFYFGVAAMEALMTEKYGQMVSMKDSRIQLVALSDAVKNLKTVDITKSYDTKRYRAKQNVL